MGYAIAIFIPSFTFLTLSFAKMGQIAIYWGQNKDDGTLASTCESGNYKIILLSSLSTFGCGSTPTLDLHAHCGVHTGIPCTTLSKEIRICQTKRVKLFISLGGASGSYAICSRGDAKVISNYLYGNFLSGQSGPLGSVALDGIHFDIRNGGSYLHWEDLLQELYGIKERVFFHLSAAPQCFLPDPYLDKAIKTGNFDYVFVRFYNSPTCQYSSSDGGGSGDASWLIESWDAWSYYVSPNTSLFLELPAAVDAAANGGYIPSRNLISDVLPYVQGASSYGGVVLWDRSRDVQTRYSDIIKPHVLLRTKTSWSVTPTSSCFCAV